MEAYKNDIDRPLSAILTINTVAHTMGAAGAGAQYARVFGNTGEAVFAGGLTLAILILTEIIPKTLGSRYAVGLAGTTSSILPVMITGLGPLVWFSRQTTRLITPKGHHTPSMHREELLAMTRLGAESGQLEERESRFVHNLIQLHSMKTWDIMTLRPVIFPLPETMPLTEFVENIFGFEIMDEMDKVADLQLHARTLWKERVRKMGIDVLDEETPSEGGKV